MTYVPIPKGTEPWDQQVNDAFADQDSRIDVNAAAIAANAASIATNTADIDNLEGLINANDVGLLHWTYDPSAPSGTTGPTAGTITMIKVKLGKAATVSNILMAVSGAGVGLTAGQNFAGLYDGAGNRLTQTADQTTAWGTNGLKTMAVTPVDLGAGFYYVAYLSNGATPPVITRGSNITASPAIGNIDAAPATARWATAGTGTTLPATINMATRTPITTTFWTAIS